MTRVLAIDPGDVRIGLALSDELRMLAHPADTLKVQDGRVVERIAALIPEKNIGLILIGLPRNMDGTYGPAAEKVRKFADELRPAVSCPVEFWDERLTTVAASRALHAAGVNSKKQRGIVDRVAAQILLQSWLDAQPPVPL